MDIKVICEDMNFCIKGFIARDRDGGYFIGINTKLKNKDQIATYVYASKRIKSGIFDKEVISSCENINIDIIKTDPALTESAYKKYILM